MTADEVAAGWQLLFDGQSTEGWRKYGSDQIGSSWKVVDGAIMLDSQQKADSTWAAADGGDIVTDAEYENFELKLEWKINACGNSGIFFNVV